jgi:hypothetical protein
VLFVTPQMSAAAGNGTANITITQGTRIESTSAFDFVIDPAAAPEDFWSEYEMAYYETVLSRLETAVLATAEAQGYAEAASSSATAAATSAEQARVIAMADAIACFPIGTILTTTNSTNPGTYIGGTWTAIEGKFLLAQSEDHTAGETGGAETVTLTVDELPSHRHGMDNYLIDDGTEQMRGWNGFTMRGKEVFIAELVKTRAVGGNMPHENMPPYLVVYMWERTA